MSHGSVYRHFESKAALRDAVTDRWLARVSAPQERIAAETGPANERLHRWLLMLSQTKRKKALVDAELFATYVALVGDARAVVDRHVEDLVEQIARIVADGVEQAEFSVADPKRAARAVFDATARFHNPAFAAQWSDPGLDDAFESVCTLILNGLRGGT